MKWPKAATALTKGTVFVKKMVDNQNLALHCIVALHRQEKMGQSMISEKYGTYG